MKRALLISPHFPPDSSAGAHRVRLLAPHLSRHGWEPTVLTLEPDAYEGTLDLELADLVPKSLRVERVAAWAAASTRRFGLGDLGLRGFSALKRRASELLGSERYDLLFITIYPSYPALIGPALARRFRIPFVLDYQDPWVGSWGLTVGSGPGQRPDWKSRLTRQLALCLEPRVVRSANAITAVSSGTYDEIFARHPELSTKPAAAIPLGLEPADFTALRERPRANRWFDPRDGLIHLCYVGTLLPLGFDTLRGLFAGAQRLKGARPERFRRLRFHFFGTSNQSTPDAPARVLPVAKEFGLLDHVSEIPGRISYLDALTVQTQASGILLLGSSEPHYTASKIYPALLAKRPILALYHQASSVVEILRSIARPPTVNVLAYGTGSDGPQALAAEVAELLDWAVDSPAYREGDVNLERLERVTTPVLAGELAALFNRVSP